MAEYRSPTWIPYRASCVVIWQDGASVGEPSTPAALVLADLDAAILLAADLPLDFTALKAALSDRNGVTNETSAKTTAVKAVSTTLSAIDGQIALQSALLSVPAGAVLTPSRLSSAFSSTIGSAGALAAAVNVRSYIGRIGVNLNGS